MEDFEKTPGKIKNVFSKIKEFFTKPTVFTENVGNNDNNTVFL